MTKVNRKYYNNIHYTIDWENSVIKLKPEFLSELQTFSKWTGFKKIGGSSVGDILIKGDPFKSEFKAYCHITKIKMPVLSKKYINAGVILEPKIFDVLRQQYKNIEIENFVASEVGYDYFQGIDDVISGVPDGYIPSMKVILEIKTAGEKKYETWEREGVDPSYRKQAQLYAYLMSKKTNSKIDKYAIVAAFLKDDKENNINDYLNPELVNLYERRMKLYSFNVNDSEVLDDIKFVKEWYKKYTSTDTSPKFNRTINADDLEYLACSNEEEWISLLEKWKSMGKADLDVMP
ncbi:hypothetical protein MCANUFG4_01491 [Mycoplasmopsis canis UFG4]|uniref:YqaJ viral recombinase domain-containing protein n=2 Tax=Mycoplasmopsis canis TaxID=29555 RepID=I1A5E9_9BACT|nr:YqaJ viral recombinase family protein [Mycoplasmopsis canis]AKF41100.1 hypothetical protein AAW50_01480 [Mycoplasmopsis canis]AMD81214.1 hypothetical protein AXW82_01415 [Mycoplasmopsis canis PG 14]EIE39722.1 hypothetical protein MCANPG14_01551 [Mycoplasmopsis canis PG 14]EIE39937.1 hypothetical protein MCANUF31_01511 [Mycoplasmopsis canis UF31]EIE40153.1 hypothetical protein MCANUF33_01531 [Mycoplasmopsis canis UF33]